METLYSRAGRPPHTFINHNVSYFKVIVKLGNWDSEIPQGVSCLGILMWLKAALTGSYEQQSFHCQIRTFSCGCFGGQDALTAQRGKTFGGQDALTAQRGKTILGTFTEDFSKKLKLDWII